MYRYTKVTLVLFIVLTMMIGNTDVYGLNIFNKDELQAYILTELSPFEKTEFTYTCKTYVEPSNAFGIEKKSRRIKEVIQKRENNQLTDEEKRKWRNLSNKKLTNILNGYQEMMSGFVYDSTWVFKAYKNKFRRDIYGDGKHMPKHFMYIFDGNEGVIVEPKEKRLRKGVGINLSSLTSMGTARFGGDLYRFGSNKLYDFVSFDPKNRELVMKSNLFLPYIDHCTYTLYDDNFAYWEKCDVIEKGGEIFQRILCEDFIEVSGMLIPAKVVIQKRSINQNKLYNFRVFTLVNTVVNNCDFGNDHFRHPESDEYNINYL